MEEELIPPISAAFPNSVFVRAIAWYVRPKLVNYVGLFGSQDLVLYPSLPRVIL